MLFTSLLSLRPLGGLALSAVLIALAAPVMGAVQADAIRQALQSGQLEQAAKLLQQEKQNNPRDVQIRFLEGVVQAQQGQTDKAIESFRKLVESNPEIVEAHNNLGVLYASKGKLDHARKALEAGMLAHAGYATLHRNLSDVQSQLAKQTYAKALQVDGKSRSAAPQLSLLGSMGLQPTGQPPASAPAVVATVPAAAAPPVPIIAPPLAAATPPVPAQPPKAPAAPAAQPAQPPRTTPQPPPERTDTAEVDAVRTAVQAWAKAWSHKDMEHYLEAYASSFVPSERQTRSKWEADRRLRILSKKSITVEVRQLKVTLDGKSATAQFQQIYASDNFTGNSRKTLELVKQGGRWLIARETVN